MCVVSAHNRNRASEQELALISPLPSREVRFGGRAGLSRSALGGSFDFGVLKLAVHIGVFY